MSRSRPAHHGRTRFLAALSALLLTAAAAHAQTWNEAGPDAGSTLPGNATSGSGPLTRINGIFANAGQDADLYQIRITNPAAFSATTVGQTTIDTQLFLFDSSGRGITFNDDATGAIRQSTITGQFVPAAGVYFLAISPYDHDPQSAGGDIWLDNPFTGERAPDGAGAASPLTTWTGANTTVGAYGIDLTGAEFFTDTTPALCPPNFAAPVNYTSTNAPNFVVIGDLNRDGRPDLVVVNQSNSVSVILASGNGVFQPAVSYPAGILPTSAAIGDLNTDGKLDLVVGSGNGSFVSVLLGNGNGTFQAQVQYPAGGHTGRVAIGDFNSDGKPDLASTDYLGGVAVLLNTGAGAFGPATFSSAGSSAGPMAVADLNSDGKLDLAVANSGSNDVSVLLGNGNGTFQPAVNYAAGDSPVGIAAADINGDGRLDLVTSNTGSENVSVFSGNGNGTFQAQVQYAAGVGPKSLTIGDLNGDGKPDLATSNSNGTNSIFLSNGNGTFQPPIPFTSSLFPTSVALGDLNGDGRTDMAVTNIAANSVSVLLQQPGTLGPTITTHPTPQAIPVGNLATFTVAATGSATFQWRRNGINLSDVGEIAGSTTATLQILPSLQGYDNSAFDCVVTNACGSTTSRPASLSLIPLCPADVDDGSNSGTRDDAITVDDLLYFLFHFEAGC